MLYVFVLFAVSVLLELDLHRLPPNCKAAKKILALTSVVMVLLATGMLLYKEPSIFAVLWSCISAFRIFNMMRVLKARMHPGYLRLATYRTSRRLVVVHSLVGAAGFIASFFTVSIYGLLLAGAVVELCSAGLLLLTVHRRLGSVRITGQNTEKTRLPTVSVLIPARNETNELEHCIRSLLQSQYPKLEIIVLDDCSQTTRTPEIIRQFAHDGVRFIRGIEPGHTWLPKNHAYQALVEASSGEMLIFAGVDVRFAPDAINRLVVQADDASKDMLSVLPRNVQPGNVPSLLQPMRYFYELAFPKLLLGSPPVLSSCWLIRRTALVKNGGLQAVRRMIIPEAFFARELDKTGRYAFLADGSSYGITSSKSVHDQHATTIRTAYPRLHRQPEAVLLPSLLVLMAAGLPSAVMTASIVEGIYVLPSLISLAALAVLYTAYGHILGRAYGRIDLPSLALFPVAVLLQLGLLYYSMYKYEFDEVIWKGRNVCIPAMHVVPRLPGL